MNVLKRNLEVIKGLADGKSLRELARFFNMTPSSLGQRYTEYIHLVDRPFYTVVSEMDFADSIGGKFIHALAEYERIHNVELTPDYIADRMSVTKFADQRGVGKALTKALAQLKEHILKERAARNP